MTILRHQLFLRTLKVAKEKQKLKLNDLSLPQLIEKYTLVKI